MNTEGKPFGIRQVLPGLYKINKPNKEIQLNYICEIAQI